MVFTGRSLSWLALVPCLALASCNVSVPPAPPALPISKVTVYGVATIKVAPDQMLWNVHVAVNDATLAAAKARHDASLTAALAYIKSLGDGVKDLQTGGIRFDKRSYFNQNEDHSKPFICSTQFTFTLTDFDKYGAICDALAKLDGVEVQNIGYAYSKQSDVRRDALKQALVDAHDKAADLAVTGNCTLAAPLEIVEGSGYAPQPLLTNKMVLAESAGTPAPVAGQIEINSSVTATYELLPK